ITAGRIVTLGGIIKGNVTIVAPEILFSRGAHIAGNLSYTSGKELLPQTGVVGGNLERVIPTPEPTFAKDKLLSHFIRFLAALFAGIPFVALFPMSTAMASQLARKMPGKCLLVGVTTSIALPILGILSISAVIGLPLGMLLLAAWGTIIYVSRFITALVLGTWILRSVRSSASQVLSAMALGLAVIYLAILVPSIAVPLQLVTAWLGMGALILALLEKRRLIIQAPQKLNTLEKLRDEIFNPEEK
ncbi:MAG TPA: hypothetical protein VIR63_02720, partial [Pontiella sp.]